MIFNHSSLAENQIKRSQLRAPVGAAEGCDLLIFNHSSLAENQIKRSQLRAPVGAAEGCDLLIFNPFSPAENQDQKIAAFGSSYRGIGIGARVLSAVPFAGQASGILARFVMPCWHLG